MRPLSIIKRETARAFSMSVTQITARLVVFNIVRPRMAGYMLSRELTEKSYEQIGRTWCREWSTVANGARRAKFFCELYPAYAGKVERARRACVKELRLSGEVRADRGADG